MAIMKDEIDKPMISNNWPRLKAIIRLITVNGNWISKVVNQKVESSATNSLWLPDIPK